LRDNPQTVRNTRKKLDLSKAIISVYSNGAVTPVYSLEQLLQETENSYGDTDLTENEKKMYYIR